MNVQSTLLNSPKPKKAYVTHASGYRLQDVNKILRTYFVVASPILITNISYKLKNEADRVKWTETFIHYCKTFYTIQAIRNLKFSIHEIDEPSNLLAFLVSLQMWLA